MRPLKSGALFAAAAAAAAQIYRNQFLRSVPIRASSHRYLSEVAGFGKTYARKRLPAELSALRYVAELTCDSAAPGGVCHVYLIGTLHGTKKSCMEVKAAIEFVKPEVVFLELCPSRADMLKPEYASTGGEFYVANEEASKYSAKIILGDRPQEITVDRFPIMAHFLEFLVAPLKLSLIKVIAVIKKLLEKDVVGAYLLTNGELARILPSRYEILNNERNRYMSATLLEVARQHKSVVAIVGMAHLQGLQKNWKQPVDMKQLLDVPTRKRMVARIRLILFCILNGHISRSILLVILLLLHLLGMLISSIK